MKNLYALLIVILATTTVYSQNQPFVTTWEVTANDLSITIPTDFGLTYNYTVDFGDGTVLNNQTGDVTHVFNSTGIYTVTINGNFPRIYFGKNQSSIEQQKIRSVEQWGDIQWQSMESAFYRCKNLVINATDAPDLSQVTDMSYMFFFCESFNQPIDHWDVSNVTTMKYVFYETPFNQPLNSWDVSNVTNMTAIFSDAASFNQPLNNWDVSNVTSMSHAFINATSFNQPLNDWDVSNVTYFEVMFSGAYSFNQDLSSWNFSSSDGNFLEFYYYNATDVENYDKLLSHLTTFNLQNASFSAGGLEYCDVASRDYLVNVLGWDIHGDSQHANCSVATENLIANNIVIYPNPTQNVLNIELRNNQDIETIKIYNLNGLELLSLKGSSEQVSLENLSSGVYFVQIKTNEGVITKRVIKN